MPRPVERVLYDTSVYIDALRRGDLTRASARGHDRGRVLYLSAVVLEELYAGAADRAARRLVARMERDFDKVERVLVANLTDWADAGLTLAQVGVKYGYEQVGRGRLTNDALIVMTASRLGVTVLTRNARDFARLAEFRPRFTWRLLP